MSRYHVHSAPKDHVTTNSDGRLKDASRSATKQRVENLDESTGSEGHNLWAQHPTHLCIGSLEPG